MVRELPDPVPLHLPEEIATGDNPAGCRHCVSPSERQRSWANCALASILTHVLCWFGLPVQSATTNLLPEADTTLHEFMPLNNFGGGDSFTAGGRIQGGRSRAVIRFDIAGQIPAGSTINSAELTLAVVNVNVNGPGSIFELFRVSAPWGEGAGTDRGVGAPATPGEASWTLRLGPATPWTTPGGDAGDVVSASQPIAAVGPYTFANGTLASDVQAWLDTPSANNGWLLKSQDETVAGTIRRFAGRLNPESPPQLVITFTPPAPPQPNPPVITNLAQFGNAIRFSFLAQSNHTYVVQFRNSFTTGDWGSLTNLAAFPADTLVHITNSTTLDERYFRVRTP